MTDYEKERQANIARNRAKMMELSLKKLGNQVAGEQQAKKGPGRPAGKLSEEKKREVRRWLAVHPLPPVFTALQRDAARHRPCSRIRTDALCPPPAHHPTTPARVPRMLRCSSSAGRRRSSRGRGGSPRASRRQRKRNPDSYALL